MSYSFETDYDIESVILTLVDVASHEPLWRGVFERPQAQLLVDMLNGAAGSYDGAVPFVVRSDEDDISVLRENGAFITVLISDGSGPYLKFKVLLSLEQAKDLASTLQMHIVASEEMGRPSGPIPPVDDTMNSGWTPEKEKQMYGGEMGPDPDDSDPAEDWKTGKK